AGSGRRRRDTPRRLGRRAPPRVAGAVDVLKVERARALGPLRSLQDFCRRTRLPRRLVEHLIMAGAEDAWKVLRRTLRWELSLIQLVERRIERPEGVINVV